MNSYDASESGDVKHKDVHLYSYTEVPHFSSGQPVYRVRIQSFSIFWPMFSKVSFLLWVLCFILVD